jgi:hypothetical protein
MFDAKSILVQFPVTILRICCLRRTNHRLLCLWGRVSPSRDTRVPQVCKSQDDSVGRSQSPFGYAVRSINDRSFSRKEGGSPAFQIVFPTIKDARRASGNTAYHLDLMPSEGSSR